MAPNPRAVARAGLAAATLVAALSLPAATAVAQDCGAVQTPISGANLAAAEGSLECLVNVYRRAKGLRALGVDPQLAAAARAHTLDMVARNYLEHDTPEGTEPLARALAAGYRGTGVGENLVSDTAATPWSLFEGWRLSPTHNANMLRTEWVGEGLAIVPGAAGADPTAGATATQMFGNLSPSAGGVSTECAAARQLYTQRKAGVKKARKRVKQAHSAAAKRKANKVLRQRLKKRDQAQRRLLRACT